ncbi:MAG: GMC family oxidoreductase [Ardenticatenaceae bacterium]|nr:GMC family oxidoreductase [Ardenticatenaceae bacterium]
MTGSKQTDVVIVGSGPGGATVARQLARANAGLAVTLLERGRDWRGSALYGTYPGAMLYSDRRSLLFTAEGLNIIRPLMLGGATSMYCGCAARPLPFWQAKYGINLDPYADETIDELHIAPLPAELRGAASTRIAAAAAELGLEWQPQDKFMSPARAPHFHCEATCMLGCRCGAKWNAAEFVDEAVAGGLDLWTGARVDRVLHEAGVVTGVVGKVGGRPFTIHAPIVILAAGGIGTPRILQRSGLPAAGQGMTMDTTVMVYGYAPDKGNGTEPPMTWSYADDELGVLFSTLIDPWLLYPLIMALKGPAYPLTWHRWGRTYGVMIKLKDEISGGVGADGRIHKGLTAHDRQRMARAEAVAGQILRQAGCDPDTIFTTPIRGTHPSGTVRLGTMLDTDLQTEIENLYVCDASVFPEALARPTVLTIIALAKRLAAHLQNAYDA